MTDSDKISNSKDEKELKISEIEELVLSFMHAHGKDKLMEEIMSIIGLNTNNNHKNNKPPKKIPVKCDIEKENSKQQNIVVNKPSKQGISKVKDINWVKAGKFILDLPKLIREKLKYKRYRYPVIAASVFLIIYCLFNLPVIWTRVSWKKPAQTQKLIVKTQEVVQKKMENSAPLAPGEVVPKESRLVVPKIKVDVPIIYAQTTDEKEVEKMLHDGVVQYNGTAKPGEIGNSFITGHSSNYWWDTGKYNYAFVLLDKLEPGDQAVVYYNGKKFIYTVRDKVVAEATNMTVLDPTDTPVMSLMTCTPPGTSWKRLIVRLDRTDPAFYKPEVVTKEKVVEVPKTKEKKKSFLDNIFSFLIPN